MIRAHIYLPELNVDLGQKQSTAIVDKTKQTILVLQKPTTNTDSAISNAFLISASDQYYLKYSGDSGAVSWAKRASALDPYLPLDGFLWTFDESKQVLKTQTGRNLYVNKKTHIVSSDFVQFSIVQIIQEQPNTEASMMNTESIGAQTTPTPSPQDAWWLWLILILIVVLLLLLLMFMLVGWGNGYRWMKKP